MNVIDAIKKKDFKLAEQMIDAGADLTVRAENERTALMYAILSGQKTLVEKMVEKGARLEDENIFKQTAVVFAIFMNRVDMLEYLADKGANLKKPDMNGTTPVEHAAGWWNADNMLTFFEKRGIVPNRKLPVIKDVKKKKDGLGIIIPDNSYTRS